MKLQIKHKLTKKSPKDRQEEIINLLLKDRGLNTPQQQETFFYPLHPKNITLKDLGIKSIQINKALALIKETIKKKRPIVIFGDYDVDGLTATATLWRFFYSFYPSTHPFIPNRFRHGYGLSKTALKEVTQKHGPSLIITVDNGITATKAVKFAKSQDHQIIITDHHQLPKKSVSADAIIHSTQVCGSGLAYIFARFLSKKLDHSLPQDALSFAALGTISDMVPLLDFNRQFVYHGLQNLAKTENPGLLALYKATSLDPESLSAGSVSFQLAPRLNASGRLGEATDSLRLLCTNNPQRAQSLTKKLTDLNSQRQAQTETGLEHALAHAQPQDKLIFLCHEDYHQGVIGLIAGKLVEKHHRPTIIVSQQEGISKASARSIKGVNIIELIRSAQDLLVSVGGHPQAAGFSVDTTKIVQLKKALIKKADQIITDDLLKKSISADIQLDPADLNLSLAQKINLLAPFGIGNPKPIFYTSDFELKSHRWVGQAQNHLQLKLAYQDKVFSGIAFNFPQKELSSPLNLTYQLDINQFRGQTKLQLIIKHLKTPLLVHPKART